MTNDAFYEDLTPESAINIVQQLAKGETPKVGSQVCQCQLGLICSLVGLFCLYNRPRLTLMHYLRLAATVPLAPRVRHLCLQSPLPRSAAKESFK